MYGVSVETSKAWGAAIAVSVVGAVGVGGGLSAALADVDVALHAVEPTVSVGEVVAVQIILSSTTGSDRLVSAVQVIFSWDAGKLQLIGNSQQGAAALLYSGFPADPHGINETNPPQNGLGLYQGWAPLGNPIPAAPHGTLLTTLLFEALAPADPTAIDIVPAAGNPIGYTIVFDGTTPNTNITGETTGTEVTIVSDCPADLTGDGAVGVADLLELLAAWGQCPPPDAGDCHADLDGNGGVGVADLLLLLSSWGACQ